jgi:hypothetical protein
MNPLPKALPRFSIEEDVDTLFNAIKGKRDPVDQLQMACRLAVACHASMVLHNQLSDDHL